MIQYDIIFANADESLYRIDSSNTFLDCLHKARYNGEMKHTTLWRKYVWGNYKACIQYRGE